MSTERDNLPVILSNLAHYDAMIKGYIKNRQNECAPLIHTHNKSEVGLSNVDNTADTNKVVKSAGKWTNSMTLTVTGAMNGSITFDGSTTSTLKLSEGDVSFKNSTTLITKTTDWNLVITPGCYNVANMGDYETYHSPYQYSTDLHYSGLLIVFKTAVQSQKSDGTNYINFYNTAQIYFPSDNGTNLTTVVTRMLISADISTGENIWSDWKPITADIANATYPGLVKSGGDVTIDSSGIITVNDDSHNHVISNIDGLQALLDSYEASGSADAAYAKAISYTDNKIAALVNSAPATLDTLKELADAITSNQEVIDVLDTAISKKLPLAGGTMDTDAEIMFNGVSGRKVYYGKNIVYTTTTINDGCANGIFYYNADRSSVLGSIAAYGNMNDLEYFYIGAQYDSSDAFRVYLDGTTTAVTSKADSFKVKDAVSLDYSETTESLTINFS